MARKIKTCFAPAERASGKTVRRQFKVLAGSSFVRVFCEAVSDIVLILNKERQIVFFNRQLKDYLGIDSTDELLGLRPGEAFRCVHAEEAEGGCGTSEFCRTCGAANAFLNSQTGKEVDTQECRITTNPTNDSLDLLVKATPFSIGADQFTVFSIKDISDEKRRRVLEKIFFHDVLNTAQCLRMSVELLADGKKGISDKKVRLIADGIDELVGEIDSQKTLAAAESDELAVKIGMHGSRSVLVDAAARYYKFSKERKVRLEIVPGKGDVRFPTDRNILLRVLGNMIKNSIEASAPGGKVSVACAVSGREVRFSVRNAGVIPKKIRLQMFQRSFSTKGEGRGIGTYSMKLLSERYLGGTVGFESSRKAGTVFTACYPIDGRSLE